MLEYLSARLASWPVMMSKPQMIAAVAFLCVLLTIDIAMRGWRLSWSRRAIESVLATIAIFHANFLVVPIIWLASEQIRKLYELLGIPSVPTEFWATTPLWLMCVFAIFAYDFANYWNHRIMHMSWLWPVHAIHHSDPEVNGLTTFRVHALESLVMWGSYTLLLTWIGLPADAIAISAIIRALHNMYVHVNVDWDHGPFRYIIASPRFHRWHHADVPEAYGKNLANFCPLYDVIFGTYIDPGKCEAPMGATATGVPENDVVKLLLYPFKEWTLMLLGGLTAVTQRIAGGRAQSASAADKSVPAEGTPSVTSQSA